MKIKFSIFLIAVLLSGCIQQTSRTNTNLAPYRDTNDSGKQGSQDPGTAKSFSDLIKTGEIAKCSSNADCVRVGTKGCCGCGAKAINKKYEQAWLKDQETLKDCDPSTVCTLEILHCGSEPTCSDQGECYLK